VQLSPELAKKKLARDMALRERRAAVALGEHAKLGRLSRAPLQAVCGLDEVGRGPLAGPVTAAAVVLDPARPVQGLNDSKKLSEAHRDALDPLIRAQALGWGLGWVWPEEIERLNIHHASLLAMRRAFAAMLGMQREKAQPQWVPLPAGQAADPGPKVLSAHDRHRLAFAAADGKHCPDLSGLPWTGETLTVIKGDALVAAISAASIIAKVARDAWMAAYDHLDGRYGFARHMGYPTPEHWAALEVHGPCPIHRQSWVAKRLPASAAGEPGHED
jgi:ribonuclease HII